MISSSTMTAQLQKFFQLGDPDGTRSVDREAFRQLCNRFDITSHDADVIFDDLDHDHDDKISFEDFSRGFSDFLVSAGLPDCDSDSHRGTEPSEPPLSGEFTKQHVWSAFTEEAERLERNSEEGKLKWLLEELQSSEKRHLVPYLENAVEELLTNLHRLQEENEKLEKSWKREKELHDRHLKRMEDEMDNQVKETEVKLRLKAQAEVEDERKSLQSKMDVEMDNLQAHLALFDKVNLWLQNQPADSYDSRLDEVRNKLNEAANENRQLRMSLLDTQTSIALMRSEVLQLRTMYEEKCRELTSEREKILEVLHEQDCLSHQLSLLHDANRRLQDTNDALRNSADVPNVTSRKSVELGHSKGKSGSIIGDYMDVNCSPMRSSFTQLCNVKGKNYEADDDNDDRDNDVFGGFRSLRRARSMDVHFPSSRKTRSCDRRLVNSLLYQSDDRNSGARDSQDEGFSSTPGSSLPAKDEDHFYRLVPIDASTPLKATVAPPDEKMLKSHQESSQDTTLDSEDKSKSFESGFKGNSNNGSSLKGEEFPKRSISEIIKQLGIKDTPIRASPPKHLRPTGRTSSAESAYKTAPVPLPRKCVPSKMQQPKENTSYRECSEPDDFNSITATQLRKQSASTSKDSIVPKEDYDDESIGTSIDDDFDYTPDGPSQQTFNVIFVGDAGVGKSSFALRISKGVFMRHMSSTLGVDFLMRSLKVDNHNVTVQLWDTAGQERFRSVTTSYFRKADGVMLLYDCTCEQSFLNVRQWVKDVDVTCFYRLMAQDSASSDRKMATHKLPLMILANKIDLRDVLRKTGTRCITTEQGEKLSKDCGAAFFEASAKDGTNVLHALADLVRCMLDNKDPLCSSSTVQLCETKQKKSGCCKK